MKKFALFNSEGFPTAFYSEDIHGPKLIPIFGEAEETEEGVFDISIIGYEDNPDCLIPREAIEITDEQWYEFITNAGFRKWNGEKVVEYIPTKNEEIFFQSLTPRQFRDALLDASILPSDVTEKINEIPFDIEREKALNAWNYASMFYRNDPYIDMIAAMFGMTPEQIDNLWIEAQEGER